MEANKQMEMALLEPRKTVVASASLFEETFTMKGPSYGRSMTDFKTNEGDSIRFAKITMGAGLDEAVNIQFPCSRETLDRIESLPKYTIIEVIPSALKVSHGMPLIVAAEIRLSDGTVYKAEK